ncbi:MAG: hypothetical protein E6H53_00130 [Betaproteobacteria bacterium]|nr:MAG: hypothetical protein E6H53_00130 [Betaproteobacteria bacterium]
MIPGARCVLPGVFALCACVSASGAPKIGDASEAKDMALVGFHDLQARSAYQPVVREQNGRWILYVGHHGGTESAPKPFNPLTGSPEFNGTSILDVTDPRAPRMLAHIPGEEGKGESGGAQMVRVCGGSELPHGDPSKVYLLRPFGNSHQEIWDVGDPAKPRLVTRLGPLQGTHKNWWECDTGIAYLVSGTSGWRTRRMTQVYDLSDPAKPRFIRNFGLAGQQPGATGEVPVELHGPISTGPSGNRVYFGYGTNKNGIVQIVDRKKLLEGPPDPTPANLLYPEIGRLVLPPNVGAHTAFPLLKMEVAEFAHDKDGKTRDFVAVVDESLIEECQEARQMLWIADITAESRPFGVASFTVPEASGDFCTRGGRFGTHSSNESFTPIYYKRILFLAYFNAGVRAVDIRDPYHPREVAYFIPAITEKTEPRCIKVDGTERCKVAIQTNNVEVDDRGYIYIVDRANTGLHILELTGEARRIAAFPR